MPSHMKTIQVDCSNLKFFYMTYDDRYAPKMRHAKGGAKKGVIKEHSMRIPTTKDVEAHSIEYSTMEWHSTTCNEEFSKLTTSDYHEAQQACAEAFEQNENEKKDKKKKVAEEKQKIAAQLEKEKEEEAQKSEEAFKKKMALSNQKFDEQLNVVKSLALLMTEKSIREKADLHKVTTPNKKTMKAMKAMKKGGATKAMKAMKKQKQKAMKKAMKAMKK